LENIRTELKSLNFFNTLNDDELNNLINISSRRKYSEDYVFSYEKENSQNLVFLLNGLAKAYKLDKNENEIFLHYIKKGEIISEISSIYDDELTTYSNISFLNDSEILSIDYKLFKKEYIDTNILTKNFLQELIKKTKNLEALVNREFIFDAVTKVAMLLNEDIYMFNNQKRYDISLVLHIQPSTLSRVLKKLKRDKIINIEHGLVTIINKEKLKYIAEVY